MAETTVRRASLTALRVPAAGWGLAIGAAVAAVAIASRRPARRVDPTADADREAALRAYLEDHLAGSDAAITTVERLQASHAGTREGALFASLYREFRGEREVVESLLTMVGGSSLSLKRMLGKATGEVLQVAAGGAPGELSLFRTLESLAIGVQGKRCLWRAAHVLAPALRTYGSQTFRDLERLAIDQWERIEDCRRSLVRRTFALP